MTSRTIDAIFRGRLHGKASDKWSSYLLFYDRIFSELSGKPISILEIGIQNGGSLEVWSEYFKNARAIVGVDVDPNCSALTYPDPRISIVIGDATDQKTEDAILSKAPLFDVIIDDGSHLSADVVRTFARYFRYLSDQGLYVVEDMHTSYWSEWGGGLYHPYSSVAFFKRLTDIVNAEHWRCGATGHDALKAFEDHYGCAFDDVPLDQINCIVFANSVCVIRKADSSNNLLGKRIIRGDQQPVMPLDFSTSPPTQVANEWSDPARSEQSILQLLMAKATADGHIAELRSQLEQERSKRAALEAEKRAIAAKVDEVEQIAAKQLMHLNAIRATTSWRLTAPLRASLDSFRLQGERLGRLARAVKGNRSDSLFRMKVERHRAPRSAPHFNYEPLISVVMPVYNVDAQWLRLAVESVRAQTYLNWELCVCDDGSTMSSTVETLTSLAAVEPRMRVIRSKTNGGISAATNRGALALAKGEFAAFLDNDGELAPHALEAYVSELNSDRSIDVLYSDEDNLNAQGCREEPFLKPDWSPHLLREVMYIGHLLMVRRSLFDEVGGFDPIYDGVQDFELMLRLSERTSNVRHVRDILYHRRRIPCSVGQSAAAKPKIGERQVAAVNEHLKRTNVRGEARPHPRLAHRAIVVPLPRCENPKISVVILTKDAPDLISRCLESIFVKTTYPNFEVVVVDNGTTDPRALASLERYPITQVPFAERFNFSRANNVGVAAASGEFLVLLNNDTEIIEGDWLEQMLFLFNQSDVGAVGPMLVYPNGRVQHAGIALGMRGNAHHVMRDLPFDAEGYFGALACTREVSGLTFACVMLRRSEYLGIGGLKEFYDAHYQGVDFCLRLRERGRRILYTPRTRLIQHESATRGGRYDMLDRALLLDVWGRVIAAGDPYTRWEPTTAAGGGDG
jgi:GT2 family glycosyltransferase